MLCFVPITRTSCRPQDMYNGFEFEEKSFLFTIEESTAFLNGNPVVSHDIFGGGRCNSKHSSRMEAWSQVRKDQHHRWTSKHHNGASRTPPFIEGGIMTLAILRTKNRVRSSCCPLLVFFLWLLEVQTSQDPSRAATFQKGLGRLASTAP